MRLANAVAAVVFALCAAVQLNDPDPLGWIAVYLAAAILCGLAAWRRIPWWAPAALAVLALGWARFLVPQAVLGIYDVFGAMDPGRPEIEVAREALGLVLVAAWMIVLAISARP